MTRRDYMWKWLAYGVALLLVAVVNYQVLTALPLHAVPVLLPMAVVAVGVLEGAVSGAGFGVAAGLLLSAATHGSPLWVAVLPLLGLVCGLLTQYVLRRDFVGFLLAGLAAGAVYEAAQTAAHLLDGAAGLETLLRVAVPEYLWTAAFSIPVYGVCHFCCRHYGRIYHE